MTFMGDRLVDDNLKRCHRELGNVARPRRRERAVEIAGHNRAGGSRSSRRNRQGLWRSARKPHGSRRADG
jgi:hypothetical protein